LNDSAERRRGSLRRLRYSSDMGSQPTNNDSQALTALADVERIRILALIAESGLTASEIADRLACDRDTVAANLAVLGRAGLVSTQKDRHERRMMLNRTRLASLAATGVPEPGDVPDQSIPRTIRQFFKNGRLTTLPAKQARYLELLGYLVGDFEIGTDYPESEVNAILLHRHEDFATLRRDLVDFDFMTRASSIYRRLR
jgi:hypothetical protein